MKPIRITTATLVLLFAATAHFATTATAQRPEKEEGNLWPGESHTFFGAVTVKWQMEPGDETAIGPVGKLIFEDANGKEKARFDAPVTRYAQEIKGPDTPAGKEVQPVLKLRGKMFVFYIDGVGLQMQGTPAGPAASIRFVAEHVPSSQQFNAASDRRTLWLSGAVEELRLNDWRLTLSADPVKYPDGAEYLEIRGSRPGAGTTTTLPAVQNATRRFGRFPIRVDRVYDDTRTVILRVDAQPDLTIRGRDAYVEELRIRVGQRWGDVLDRLGKMSGLDVEWVADPSGHKESIEYAKSLQFGFEHGVRNGILKDLLEKLLAKQNTRRSMEHLAAEWASPTRLRVWAKNYDLIVAGKEREAKRIEESKRRRIEEELQEKELAQKNKQVQAEFEAMRDLTTRIYELQLLSASAAQNLIEPELKVHYLYKAEDTLPLGLSNRIATRRIADEIIPGNVVDEIQERCVADDRTNVVIVAAAEDTHRKVGELLHEWEDLVSRREARGPLTQYRLEIVLLQGGKAGEPVEAAAGAIRLSPTVEGRLIAVEAKAGAKVKSGATIAKIDSSQLENRIEHLQIELSSLESQLEQAHSSLKRLKSQHEAGVATSSEYETVRAKLAVAETEHAKKRLELETARREQRELTIRAPRAGTITAVHFQPGEIVKSGDVVALLVPDEKPDEAGPAAKRFSTALADQYGIGPDDFKMFGFDGLADLGRGIVSLAAEKGEAGRAVVSLTENYRCELEFQDLRRPYLIIRGRLIDAKSDKPLLENTLFLEDDEPFLLGLTNLRQALILVVRRYEVGKSRSTSPTTLESRKRGP